MFRWFRALWHWFAGIFSGAADNLQTNASVMAATYDAAIAKQGDRFNAVQKAVSDLMALKLKRVDEIKGLNEKIAKLTKIQQGAAAIAKKRVEELKLKLTAEGLTGEALLKAIQNDPEYIKHMAAFADAGSSLKDAEAQVKEKEQDMHERGELIAKYQAELQQMQRNVQKLSEEKSDAIAQTQIAKQAEAVNRVLAGIAQDTTDKDLEAARKARDRAKASATIMADLTSNDAQVAESTYLKYASDTTQQDEFAKLVGLDEGKTAEAAAPLNSAVLPEG